MENSLCPYFPTIICGVRRHSTRDRWVARQNPISCTWDLTGSTTKSSRCLMHSRSKKRTAASATHNTEPLSLCAATMATYQHETFRTQQLSAASQRLLREAPRLNLDVFPKARTSTRRFGGRRTMEELPAAVPGSLTSRD